MTQAAASAFRYFSIIPLGRVTESTPPDGYAIVLLPLVGAFVGALSGAAGWLTAKVAAPPLPALVAFALLVMLSGAIHLDGFLDCCDALLASATPQRRLEILKDPRHGTYAVVGMVLLALFWVAALAQIPPSRLVLTLAFSGALARLCAVPLLWFFPYARSMQTSRAIESPQEIAVLVALAFGTALLGALAAPAAVALVPVAVLFALAIGWVCARRLGGGVTGDVYGAVIVLTEVAVLLAIGAVAWR